MRNMDEATCRQVRAGCLMLPGKTPTEATHAVGVARQATYTRKGRLDEGGIDALRSMTTGQAAHLESPARATQANAVDRLGRCGPTQKPHRARVPRQHPGRHSDANGTSAWLRAGPQPRGVSVGPALAPRAGRLLPQLLGPTREDRPQQAAQRSVPAIDHHRARETSRTVVMSSLA